MPEPSRAAAQPDSFGVEQVRVLRDVVPTAVLSNLLLAVIVAPMLWGHGANVAVAGWVAALAVVQFARVALWLAGPRHAGANPGRWLFLLRVGVVLTGAAWGALWVFLFPDDYRHQLFLGVICVGVAGAAVVALTVDRVSAWLYVAAILVPLAARLLLQGDEFGLTAGAATLLYLAYLAAATRRGERAFRDSHALRERATRQSARLRDSESRFQRATEASGVVLWDADAETGEVYLGEGWSAIVEGPPGPARWTVPELVALVPAEERKGLMDAATAVLKGQHEEYAVEHRVRGRGGEWRWVLSRGRVTERDPATGRAKRMSGTNTDITERKRAEEALRNLNETLEQRVAARTAELSASERRYQRLVENSHDAIMIDDTAGRIVFANRRFLELFGIEAHELPQLTLENYVAPEHRAALRERHDRRVAGEKVPELFEYAGLRRDGTRRWLEVRVSKIVEDGAIVGTQSAIRDITKRKAAETALRESEERLRRLNAELEQRVAARTEELQATLRELESFSYTVSHDLRAPVRAVAGFSQMLIEDFGHQLDPGAHRLLGRVSAAGRTMGEMIDGLLGLSRISRNPLQRRAIDLGVLAAEVWSEVVLAEPDRRVALDIASDLVADGDPVLLRTLLLNLLGNAFKYTRHTADARVAFGRGHDDAGKDAFFVRDNGTGFDMQYAGKLFDAFQRLHTASEFEGSGIGLATVRRIVERHGGRVWAESRPGAGATFWFTLGPARAPA